MDKSIRAMVVGLMPMAIGLCVAAQPGASHEPQDVDSHQLVIEAKAEYNKALYEGPENEGLAVQIAELRRERLGLLRERDEAARIAGASLSAERAAYDTALAAAAGNAGDSAVGSSRTQSRAAAQAALVNYQSALNAQPEVAALDKRIAALDRRLDDLYRQRTLALEQNAPAVAARKAELDAVLAPASLEPSP